MAEVLITLGVIGIVASMTLPALVNNNRNKQLEAGLWKSYSVISQALDMYQAEVGERISTENIGTQVGMLGKSLKKYLNVAGECDDIGAFWGQTACTINGKRYMINYKTFNNYTNIKDAIFDGDNLILNDGMFLIFENGASWNSNRLFISVDVNGFYKNPNLLGHDLFIFQIDKNGKLLPMGAEGTQYYDKNDAYCSPTSTNNMNGAGCTYKALTDKYYFKNLK